MNLLPFKEKIKANKTILIVSGSVVVAIAGAVILSKRVDLNTVSNATQGPVINIPDKIEVIQSNCDPEQLRKTVNITVTEHLRNLPNGRRPSADRVAAAAAAGISLGEHQTLVSEHNRNWPIAA